MSLKDPGRMREYVDTVCGRIRFRDLHPQIRLELEGHIEDHRHDLIGNGMAQEQALDQALKRMGDPDALGKQLDAANRPPLEWSLLMLAGFLLVVGLFTLHTIESHELIPHQIFARSVVFAVLGVVVVGITTLLDYRRILPLSAHIYALSAGSLALARFTAGPGNGIHLGFATVSPVALAPYFLLIGLAGMFTRWKWERSSWHIWALALLLLTVLFMTIPAMGAMILYIVGFFILMAASGATWRRMVQVGAAPVALIARTILAHPYRWTRMAGFLHPGSDPLGSGYLHLQIREAIRSAGWWGQGANLSSVFVPEPHTDFIFTFIVHAFGWGAGLVILGLATALVVQLARTAVRSKDRYGRLIAIGLASILLVQQVWHILMTVGWAPVTGMGLPFVGYGGSLTLMNMLALGLILSVHRRRDREIMPNYGGIDLGAFTLAGLKEDLTRSIGS